MKQLYELIEDIRDTIAKKLLPSYSLENVYRATLYAFTYVALREKGYGSEVVKPLEKMVSPVLVAAVRRELFDKIHYLISKLDAILSDNKPVIAYGEADLEHVIETVKHGIGRVNYVIVYDCMSVIEQVVVSAYLEAKGVPSLFLNVVFLNPLGLTRFMTGQLVDSRYRQSLRGVGHYVAQRLNALLYTKNSFIDMRVHESGLLGLDEFVKNMDVKRIVGEVLEASINGRVLVFSDHGYDIVLSREGKYLYVVHGFRQKSGFGDIPLLLLSRVSLFMGVYGMR